ncbi:MAG: c-type cytochrome [Sphingomicrobium sp.]
MTGIDRSKLLLVAGTTAFLAAACNSIATAQPASAPAATPQFKNLQVLPKDITRDQLMTNMKFFAQSLGVRCSYCHVGEEGKSLSTYDFASDANPHKNIARGMMRLTWRLNAQDLPAIEGLHSAKSAKVTCFTCHRGAKEPLTEIPASPPPAG